MAEISSGNIWIDTFQSLQNIDLEEKYGHRWILQFNHNLVDSLTEEQKQNGWKISQTTKAASFVCDDCNHFWDSGRVSLVFHYRLREATTGTVLLRIFRQKCRACDDENFMRPSFGAESVKTILENIILKIRKNCYRERINSDTKVKMPGIMKTKPHERELCEACKAGICNKEQDTYNI